MKRKIMKLGPATMVISLPSKWVKQTGAKQGDEIDVDEQDNALIIRSKGTNTLNKETLDLKKVNKLYKRIYASKYLKGTDEIEVHFDTLEKSRAIQKRTDDMIGMEVIEQTKDKLVIKDISSDETDNFDNILKRVTYLMNSLSEETLKAIKNKETNLEYLEDLEKNMNKFTDYCFRILNRKGHKDYKETAVLYCILFLLEETGDEYKKFITYIQKNKLTINNELVKIYEDIDMYSRDIQKLFLKFSYENAILVSEKRDKIIGKIDKLLCDKKTKNNEIIILKHFEAITENSIKIMGQLLNIN